MGRQTTNDDVVGGQTLPEIKDALFRETGRLKRLKDGKITMGPRRSLFPGNLVNGLAVWFLNQPPDAREQIARAGVERYRQHLDSDEELPFIGLGGVSLQERSKRGRKP